MKITLIKKPGALVPADTETEEFISRLKLGQVIHADFKKMRNYKFHQKYFNLLRFAFDHLEYDDIEYKGQKVLPNFEKFRNDIAILCGYSTPIFNINGQLRLIAKSISFSSMSEEEFEKLYSKSIDIILQKVLKNYTRDDLDSVLYELLGYA